MQLSFLFPSDFVVKQSLKALQWWNGRPPSDGLLIGSCILLTGLACVPIVALHFSHVVKSAHANSLLISMCADSLTFIITNCCPFFLESAKRCLVLVVATGILFVMMQPPIPVSWAYHSDLIRAAHQSGDGDDISIYGFMASKPTWPSWLIIAAIVLTLAAITSIIPIKYIVEFRTLYSIVVGITLGIYVSAEYFLQAAILHALIIVTMICTSVFVVFTHLPSA